MTATNYSSILYSLGSKEYKQLGAGMEGVVFGSDQSPEVVKIWNAKSIDHLYALKAFYESFSSQLGEIASPEIHEIHCLEGKSVTVEKKLAGTPLSDLVSENDARPAKVGIDATVAVLSAMACVSAEAMKILPILDEGEPVWSTDSWTSSIMAIVTRRRVRFAKHLDRDVPNINQIMNAVESFLSTRSGVELGLVHGDLCPSNIHLDHTGACSVLDFGFLSTLGDPAFDASISSAVYSMYGPNARQVEDAMVEALCDQLGHDRSTLLAYRAVYALLTSNAYELDGKDGHYDWCITMLHRPDVLAALEA